MYRRSATRNGESGKQKGLACGLHTAGHRPHSRLLPPDRVEGRHDKRQARVAGCELVHRGLHRHVPDASRALFDIWFDQARSIT